MSDVPTPSSSLVTTSQLCLLLSFSVFCVLFSTDMQSYLSDLKYFNLKNSYLTTVVINISVHNDL